MTEKKIREHFKKSDPILFSVLEKVTPLELLVKSDEYFPNLCEVIINQQLSTKAAATIFNRFKKLFPQEKIKAEFLLKFSDEKVRSVGTSFSKIKFMKDLAAKVVSQEIILEKLDACNDEEVKLELRKIKGVGPWTAEMFMIFSLAREDIFSYGDLGLQKAIQKLYRLKAKPSVKQMEKLSKKWIPYRTYAARILWKSLEI